VRGGPRNMSSQSCDASTESRTAKPRLRPCAWRAALAIGGRGPWRQKHFAAPLGQHSNCLDESFPLRSSKRPATALFPSRLGERVWRCAARCAISHLFTKAEPEAGDRQLLVARQSGRPLLLLLDTLGERQLTTVPRTRPGLAASRARASCTCARVCKPLPRKSNSMRGALCSTRQRLCARGVRPLSPSKTATRSSWKQTC
jgi:hypothetical protein